MPKTKTKIEFTDEEARQYAEYLVYKAKIDAIIKSNALEAKNGAVTMHFDHDGNIRKIEANVCLFQK